MPLALIAAIIAALGGAGVSINQMRQNVKEQKENPYKPKFIIKNKKEALVSGVTTPAPIAPATPVEAPAQPVSPQVQANLFRAYLDQLGQGSQEKQVPADLYRAIQSAATKHDVPERLLAAIADHESMGFTKTKEIGGGKGRGYFQIDLGQHPDVTEEQALDPNFSANYAANLLKSRLNQYGSAEAAIRAYNGNPGVKAPRNRHERKAQERTQKYLEAIKGTLTEYSFRDPGNRELVRQHMLRMMRV